MPVRLLKLGLCCVLCACAAPFFFLSLHWPLVGDASLIHYICFLMDHGMAPYRVLGDMNMPGALLVEWAAMHTFGGGELAWRFFDFFLLALASAGIAVITRRRDWFAGVFAATLFILVHGRDGFAQAGQRDLVLAVSLLLATSFLFLSVRRLNPAWMVVFGLFAGLAATIKPTALPEAILLLVLAAMALRHRGESIAGYAWYACTASLAAPLVCLGFLLRQHALAAFLHGLRTVVPFYASLGHRPLVYLLTHSVSPILPLLLIWLAILLLDRPKLDWERAALLAGALCGLLAYVLQARGFPYYRYNFLLFLLPLIALDFCAALNRPRPSSLAKCSWFLAIAGVVTGSLIIAPMSIQAIRHFDPGSIDFITSLEQDLNRLGGPALSGNIQCVDSISGCGTTLYRMRLVQSTGILSDFLLFGSAATAPPDAMPGIVTQTRAEFTSAMAERPPQVIVVSSWLHIDGPGDYRKLERWPAFQSFLTANYALEKQWTPTRPNHWWSRPQWPDGYRVYLRRLPAR